MAIETRENFVKAIKMESPDTIPINMGVLPMTWFHYGDKFQKLIDKFPQFFHGEQVDIEELRRNMRPQRKLGTWTDSWGCVWHNNKEGMDGIVLGHPLKTEDDIYALKIPEDRSGKDMAHGFMYLRLADLYGFENTMMLFGEESEALNVLIDKVCEYNIYQAAARASKKSDVYSFGDDLGTQHGLAVGAAKWRKYLKPCFRKIYGTIKAARPDALIYMHTDGQIYEIMPDLVECGVDMINPQFRANGIDNLKRVCREERIIPIDLDLDRQMMPFATPAEIRDHVAECVSTFYLPEGGLSLRVEINYDYPLENIEALLESVEKYRHFKG